MILGRLLRFISHFIGRIDLSFSKKKYFRAVALMLFLTSYLPLVSENLPSPIGSHHLYVLLWFGSILIFAPKLIIQKKVLYLLFYGLLFVGLLMKTLWVYIDGWNRSILEDEFYVYFVSISVITYFIMAKDYKGLAWLVKWSLIFIGITAIMTIYSTTIDPMYIRKTLGGEMTGYESFKKLGGGGYAYISALVSLFPIMIYYYQNSDISIFSKKVIFLFGILCFYTIVRSQIFANMLLASVVIGISLLGRKKMKQSIMIVSFFFIIFILIPKSIYAEILESLSSLFDPNSNVYFKLNDMATYLVAGDKYSTGADARAARYPMLLEAFSENLLFGYSLGNDLSKYSAEGGHIYWMNKLAVLGLFGFVPFIFIHFSYIKSSISFINKEYSFYFLISVLSIISLGLMKALIGRELWMVYFVVLLGAYFLPLLKKRKQTQTDGKAREKKIIQKRRSVRGIEYKTP